MIAIFTAEDMKARSTEELYSSNADEEDTKVKNYASDEDDNKIIKLDMILSFQIEVQTLFNMILIMFIRFILGCCIGNL